MRGLAIFVLALFLVGCMTVVGQTSTAHRATFTTETFDPFGLLGGPPVGEILSPGVVRCPGYEPTGDPMQPCPPGSRIHYRDQIIHSRVDSDDPLHSGWATITLNANYDAAATGPLWGTLSLALDAGGTWDGTFQGMRVQEGNLWVAAFHISAQGTGGAVDGMHLLAVSRMAAPTPVAFLYTGTIQGRKLDPHAK